jgi:DNA-binding ferritin-like protein
MNEYQKLCAMLKALYENLFVLHHNLNGGGAWKGNHEWLGDWYEETGSEADHLIELGLQMGYKEPTIAESLMMFPAITSDDRIWPDTQKIVMEYFVALMAQMDKARAGQPADVDNKIQEYQGHWRTEMYKLGHAIGVGDIEDED